MTATTPLVSVCLVCFNHVDYVTTALESAAMQDYPALEVVVGDDGSTDGTYARLEALAARFGSRVRLLAQRCNTGLAGIVENYNRVLRECRGEYVAFLEGDDYYLPGKVSAQVAWLAADPRRILCGHDVDVFDSSSGKGLYRWSERFGLSAGVGAAQVIERGVPFSTVSVMVRRSAVPQEGFDPRLRVVLDWKFWIDLLGPGGHFGFVPGVFARYRRHSGGVSIKFAETGRDDQFATLGLLESQQPLLIGSCRRGRARLNYALGLHGLLDSSPLSRAAARARLREAARLSPVRYWKALPALVASALAPGWYRRMVVGRPMNERSSK